MEFASTGCAGLPGLTQAPRCIHTALVYTQRSLCVQIVTSAVGNKPPGNGVVQYIAACVRDGRSVAPGLQEHVPPFFRGVPGLKGSDYLVNQMNICQLGCVMDERGNASLAFKLVILNKDGNGVCAEAGAQITRLLPKSSTGLAAAYECKKLAVPEKKKTCGCL